MTANAPINEDPKPPVKKRHMVRNISAFLAIILFVPAVSKKIEVKLFKWQDGYFGLDNALVILALAILLYALMVDDNDKIEIPFLSKFMKND